MKSLKNIAEFLNPICVIVAIKPTKCNPQLMRLLHNIGPFACKEQTDMRCRAEIETFR